MELNRAVLHQCLISRQREADSSAKTGTVLPCTPTTETQEQRDMGTGPRGLTDTLARSREKLAFFLPPNTVASHDVPMNACWGHTGVGHKLKKCALRTARPRPSVAFDTVAHKRTHCAKRLPLVGFIDSLLSERKYDKARRILRRTVFYRRVRRRRLKLKMRAPAVGPE